MKIAVRIFCIANSREQHNAALQRPGDNCLMRKLSMRDPLIPVRCERLLGTA